MTRTLKPDFDFSTVALDRTELIIRLEIRGVYTYLRAIIDDSVQRFLHSILVEMQGKHALALRRPWEEWDYGNEAQTSDALVFPWQADGITELQAVLEADRLDRDPNVLSRTEEMNAYFVRFVDGNGRQLVGVKLAARQT